MIPESAFRRCGLAREHEAHGWIFTEQTNGGWANVPSWCDGLVDNGDDTED